MKPRNHLPEKDKGVNWILIGFFIALAIVITLGILGVLK